MLRVLFALTFLLSLNGYTKMQSQKSGGDQQFNISVNTENDKVIVNGEVNSKGAGKAFKKTFKAAFRGKFQSRNFTGAGRDIYVGPSDEVDDVVVVGGEAIIEGHVLGDVVAVGGSVIIKPGAVIEGDLVCVGGSIDRSSKSVVKGSVTRVFSGKAFAFIMPLIVSLVGIGTSFVFCLIYLFWMFSLFLVVGLAALYFMPKASGNVKSAVYDKPVLSFFIGLVAAISFFPINLILIISIIWIFFIPFAAILFLLLACWGLSIVFVVSGEKLPLKKERNVYINFFMGFAIFFLLSLIPFIGKALIMIAGFIGLGAVVLSKFGSSAATRKENLDTNAMI